VWFKTWRIPDICVWLYSGIPRGYEVQLLAYILVDEGEGRFSVEPTPLRGVTRQTVRDDFTVEFRSVVFENTSYKSAGQLFHLALEVCPLAAHAPSAVLRECWLCEGVKVVSKRVRVDDGAPAAGGPCDRASASAITNEHDAMDI
jgi:hypothetical protein